MAGFADSLLRMAQLTVQAVPSPTGLGFSFRQDEFLVAFVPQICYFIYGTIKRNDGIILK